MSLIILFKKMKYCFSILLFFVLSTALAQADYTAAPSGKVSVQPTVMVIPFTKADDDMRAVFEDQNNGVVRAAISRVKDGLDQRGIQTIDFRAVLKQLNNTKALTTEQQSSVKQTVIEYSAADIYIESETQIIKTPTGNSVTVILTAYDAFTGRSLVNKLGHSPKFYTDNFEKLAEKALDKFLDKFIHSLDLTLKNMLKNGRSIAVDIGIAEASSIDMDSEVNDNSDLLLSDLIESWLEENAFQAHFHIQGITATKMIIDEVKIPMLDPKTKKNYRPSKFAAQLRKFLQTQGLNASRDVQGSKIFITISD